MYDPIMGIIHNFFIFLLLLCTNVFTYETYLISEKLTSEKGERLKLFVHVLAIPSMDFQVRWLFYTFKKERFIALNNLTDNQGIKTGQLLKLIVWQ